MTQEYRDFVKEEPGFGVSSPSENRPSNEKGQEFARIGDFNISTVDEANPWQPATLLVIVCMVATGRGKPN